MSETRKIAVILVANVGDSRVAGRHLLHARLGELSSALGEFPNLRAYLERTTRRRRWAAAKRMVAATSAAPSAVTT
jgi:hypothetical protein